MIIIRTLELVWALVGDGVGVVTGAGAAVTLDMHTATDILGTGMDMVILVTDMATQAEGLGIRVGIPMADSLGTLLRDNRVDIPVDNLVVCIPVDSMELLQALAEVGPGLQLRAEVVQERVLPQGLLGVVPAAALSQQALVEVGLEGSPLLDR